MHEDEALLAAIIAKPSHAKSRLAYFDWMRGRSESRSQYVRAELTWASKRSADAEARLRAHAKRLDPVWVARISRPPIGVCCDHVRFTEWSAPRTRPQLSDADVKWLEIRFGLQLPADYKAFLLNNNGGEPEPQYFRHDLITQRFGIALPAGYDGCKPDMKGKDYGPTYGLVSRFTTIWSVADSVPRNADASGDWSPDLVNNLQLLEHWRSGVPDWPAAYWREGLRRDLIWIGHGGPTGNHEVFCLGVRGAAAGRVYHSASHPDHACECDDCLLIAPSFAAFLGLLAAPVSQHRRLKSRRTKRCT